MVSPGAVHAQSSPSAPPSASTARQAAWPVGDRIRRQAACAWPAHASSKPPAPSDRQPAVVASVQATAVVCAQLPMNLARRNDRIVSSVLDVHCLSKFARGSAGTHS